VRMVWPGSLAVRTARQPSNACAGEERALFDELHLAAPGERRNFHEWYPDPIPGSRTSRSY
jgi:hypothetical protein